MSKLWKPEKIAEVLKVKTTTIYNWVNQGIVPYDIKGKFIKFRRRDIEAWLIENTVNTKNNKKRRLRGKADLLDVPGVAELLRVREMAVYQWRVRKMIPCIEVGGRVLFWKVDIDEWSKKMVSHLEEVRRRNPSSKRTKKRKRKTKKKSEDPCVYCKDLDFGCKVKCVKYIEYARDGC